jgi:hypothetical protein
LFHFREALKAFIKVLLIESVKWLAYLLHEFVVVELNALFEMGLVPLVSSQGILQVPHGLLIHQGDLFTVNPDGR